MAVSHVRGILLNYFHIYNNVIRQTGIKIYELVHSNRSPTICKLVPYIQTVVISVIGRRAGVAVISESIHSVVVTGAM